MIMREDSKYNRPTLLYRQQIAADLLSTDDDNPLPGRSLKLAKGASNQTAPTFWPGRHETLAGAQPFSFLEVLGASTAAGTGRVVQPRISWRFGRTGAGYLSQ